MPTLMERQLDPVSAGLLEADLQTRGIKVLTEANTKAILGYDCVEGVELADGTRLPADIVVMAAGIRPNIALATQAGLACGRGVQVDDAMLTSDPSIYGSVNASNIAVRCSDWWRPCGIWRRFSPTGSPGRRTASMSRRQPARG
jgi:nitrite reductase (NADH) large subunit